VKTLIPAIFLFLCVLAFIVTNTILLGNLFSDIEELLSELPTDDTEISVMTAEQVPMHADTLEKICKKWKSREQYIYITLEHDVSGEFYDTFLPAVKFFESGDYASYLANLAASKDILKQIKQNEKLAFGTIF